MTRAAAIRLLLALLGVGLGACHGTLYDAAGVPALVTGTTCGVGTHDCGNGCVAVNDLAACGTSCQVCSATSPKLPVCDLGLSQPCTYTCPAGQLVCPSGCCQAKAVAAGQAHACAITDPDGSLVCWGANNHGQLGPGVVGATSTRPAQVFASGVTAVAAGGRHTCAVHAGEVVCWGDDAVGQLGNGATSTGTATPVATGVSGATALALGDAHSCALVAAGVTCWGANGSGQLGQGDTAPHPTTRSTPIASGATALAAAADTTCAAVGTSVHCWGADESGQVGAGAGPVTRPPQPTPIAVAGLPAVAAVSLAVGHHHACAAFDQPSGLWCWGANDLGQLGTGAAGAASPSPVQASKLDNTTRSILVAAGDGHTCSSKALAPPELICAGRNDLQQAGAASPSPALEGLAVAPGGNLVPGPSSTVAGADFTCALVDVGAGTPQVGVKCWGGNASGQLGRNTVPAGDPAGTPEFITP
jgi:alpha-tubulin suppressor-like RCC1 family protein